MPPQDMFRDMLMPMLIKFAIFIALFLAVCGLFFYLLGRAAGLVWTKIWGLFEGKPDVVFRARQSPLTDPEQELFRRLAEAMPEHFILSQVSYGRLLYAAGSDKKTNVRAIAETLQKTAGFVVCGPRFDVAAVVELDDSSPGEDDGVIARAGFKTVRWHVSALPGREEIRLKILGLGAFPSSV